MTKAKEALLLIAVLLVCVIGAELMVRHFDGLPSFSLALPNGPMQGAGAIAGRDDGRHYALAARLADGVDIKWFDEDPPPLAGRLSDPALLALSAELPATELRAEVFKLWNSQYFLRRVCSAPRFSGFPQRAFLFDPVDGSEHPPYRFPYDVTTPMTLRTNQFGFRGPPIALDKPPRTIRVAFVGASTTVSEHLLPFSYPELIGHWLGLWAKRKGLNVAFEAINAGREGIDSTDIEAVVRTELLPLEPDMVVYYEGSNQFWPGSIVPSYAAAPARRDPVTASNTLLDWLGQYSALARRFAALADAIGGHAGAEPNKPEYSVVWPRNVDEFDPSLDAPNLPSNLPTILKDLDAIRLDAESVDGEMVMTSFRWLVKDGMVLDPIKHRSILNYLNVGFYPFHYREMERLAAFQNRAFAKWAAQRGVPFIDIAGQLPFAPDLMADAIHDTYPGVRVRAWLMLQDLIPLIARRIEAGRWPKPVAAVRLAHPAFPANPHTVAFDCNLTPLMTQLPPITPNNSASAVTQMADRTVAIHTAPLAWQYAADAYIPAGLTAEGKAYKLEIEARVTEGDAYAGVLAADDSRWLGSGELPAGPDFAKVTIPFRSDTRGRGRVTVFTGPANAAATVEIRAIRLNAAEPTIRTLGPGLIAN